MDSDAKCFIVHMFVYAHFCGLHSDTERETQLIWSTLFITVLLLFQQVLLLKRTVMDVQD